MNFWLKIILTAFMLSPSVALAQMSEKDVASGKIRMQESSGYIFLHGAGRQGGTFIRIPDDEDIAEYQKARDLAFEKELKRYQKQLKSWEADVAAAKQLKKSPPEKPVKPTQENFSIGPIAQRTAVQFGPDFAFSKDKVKDKFSYFITVKPGTYIWYGPILFDPQQGFVGVCYCMGSVKFDVKPNVITNIGNYLLAAPLAEKQKTAPFLEIRHSGGWNGFKVELPAASSAVDLEMPASLTNWPTTNAAFTAIGKMDNFYGLMISRLPPIPGILAYDRDKVIDVTSGAAVSDGI